MIGNFGMGEDLKVFYNEETENGRNPFLGRSLAMGCKYSEKTKEKMDEESLTLVKEAYKEAFQILSRNKNTLSVLCKINVSANIKWRACHTNYEQTNYHY